MVFFLSISFTYLWFRYLKKGKSFYVFSSICVCHCRYFKVSLSEITNWDLLLVNLWGLRNMQYNYGIILKQLRSILKQFKWVQFISELIVWNCLPSWRHNYVISGGIQCPLACLVCPLQVTSQTLMWGIVVGFFYSILKRMLGIVFFLFS